jgi:signal transduction histidine kinase
MPQRGYGYPLFFALMMFQSIAMLVSGYRLMRQVTGVRKIEMQIFVLNTSFAGIFVVPLIYAGRTFDFIPLVRSGPFIFILSFGITIWVITSHRIFDARQVVASVAYRISQFALLTVIAVIFAAQLQNALEWPYDILLAAISAGLLALITDRPIRRWFGLDDDHRLVAPRKEVVRIAKTETEVTELKTAFEKYLGDECQTDRVVLLPAVDNVFSSTDLLIRANWPGFALLCREGWVTPELLQRRRPEGGSKECSDLLSKHNLGALLAVPPGSNPPTLLIALGLKRGLRPYTYPDIRLLLNLAELMDNILTHANLAHHAAKIARMEAAALISRSLAHDLSNLTTPVATYLLHSQDRAAPGTPEAEVYDAALHSVKVMHDYIRESLFFSRRLVPDLKEVEPAAALASIVRLSHDRATRRGIVIKAHCRSTTRFIADPVLFQRLAQNLVSNAIDASPPEGEVTILITDREPAQLCLIISDQGRGVRPENLHRIFDPYFTTKDTGHSMRGLGLGLAICQKITELHGGRIDVSSEWGHGATFTAVFPVSPAPQQPARESQAARRPRAIPLYAEALPRPA